MPLRTDETRGSTTSTCRSTDQLIDACRTCVHVIDDPKLPDGAGLVQVRERFADVHRTLQAWDDHVRAACVRHRLAPPSALPRAMSARCIHFGSADGARWCRAGASFGAAPVPTLAAVAGTLTAALAARAAWVRAGEALGGRPPGPRAPRPGSWARAVAALLVDADARGGAHRLCRPAAARSRRTLALRAPRRTPGMISVRAVELLLYFTLALGELFVLVRGLDRSAPLPARRRSSARWRWRRRWRWRWSSSPPRAWRRR